KGAVHAYTHALRMEARAYGVHVSEVLPISVRTRFFQNVKGEKYRPSGIVLTSEQVADSIVRCAAARHPKAEVLPYRPIRAVFVLDALFPGLLDRFAAQEFAEAVRRPPTPGPPPQEQGEGREYRPRGCLSPAPLQGRRAGEEGEGDRPAWPIRERAKRPPSLCRLSFRPKAPKPRTPDCAGIRA